MQHFFDDNEASRQAAEAVQRVILIALGARRMQKMIPRRNSLPNDNVEGNVKCPSSNAMTRIHNVRRNSEPFLATKVYFQINNVDLRT